MDVAIMRVFEICLKSGHSWLCLKHIGERSCMCVCVLMYEYPFVDECVVLHVHGMCRTLSKYDSCNHSHALQLAPQAGNSWVDTHHACGQKITADTMRNYVCACVCVREFECVVALPHLSPPPLIDLDIVIILAQLAAVFWWLNMVIISPLLGFMSAEVYL